MSAPQNPAGAPRSSERPHDHPGGQPDAGLILHTERIVAGTEPVVHSRARIGKRIVTERVSVEVDLRREEFYVEYLPPDGAQPEYAADGSVTFGDEVPREMILYREEPVIATRVVPVERITYGREVLRAVAGDEVEWQREELDIDTAEQVEPRQS